MNNIFPEWATEKQREGMAEFIAVAKEYVHFDIEFKQSDWGDDDETRFYAFAVWGDGSKGTRRHEFDIAWYREKTWRHTGEECEPHWQFLFAGGDATREISTEVFFLELFWYLDRIAVTKAA